MNEETFKRKMRAAIWKAFMQFEKDIESEDAEAELKERFDKYVKSEKLDKKAKRSILCRLGFHEYYGKPISGKGYITDGQCRRPGCLNFK